MAKFKVGDRVRLDPSHRDHSPDQDPTPNDYSKVYVVVEMYDGVTPRINLYTNADGSPRYQRSHWAVPERFLTLYKKKTVVITYV